MDNMNIVQEDEPWEEDFQMAGGFIPVDDTYRLGSPNPPEWYMEAVALQQIIVQDALYLISIRGFYMAFAPRVVLAKAGGFFSVFETETVQ